MTYLTLFYTHSGAIKFELYLASVGKKGKTMPVPRKLSSSCGVCNMCDLENLDMDGMNIEDIDRIYQMENQDYKLVYQGEE